MSSNSVARPSIGNGIASKSTGAALEILIFRSSGSAR